MGDGRQGALSGGGGILWKRSPRVCPRDASPASPSSPFSPVSVQAHHQDSPNPPAGLRRRESVGRRYKVHLPSSTSHRPHPHRASCQGSSLVPDANLTAHSSGSRLQMQLYTVTLSLLWLSDAVCSFHPSPYVDQRGHQRREEHHPPNGGCKIINIK